MTASGSLQSFSPVLVRGAGDLGTGAAASLFEAGLRVAVLDLPRPTCLRVEACFATAALRGRVEIDGVVARRVDRVDELAACAGRREVPVWVGEERALLAALAPRCLVEARMRGLSLELSRDLAPLVIALGPGYRAGRCADYVIETQRGPDLGRVIVDGEASAYTGRPGVVAGVSDDRLLRSPRAGRVERLRSPGDFVRAGEAVARVGEALVRAAISGMIRGLKLDGVEVGAGHKIGDVDPRRDRGLLARRTDKSRAVGAGVLEALSLALGEQLTENVDRER